MRLTHTLSALCGRLYGNSWPLSHGCFRGLSGWMLRRLRQGVRCCSLRHLCTIGHTSLLLAAYRSQEKNRAPQNRQSSPLRTLRGSLTGAAVQPHTVRSRHISNESDLLYRDAGGTDVAQKAVV